MQQQRSKWKLESAFSKTAEGSSSMHSASSASYRLLVHLNIVEEANELPIGWAAYGCGHRFN
jgi:hypothetical protein